jgi:hypothetical protein
MFHFLHDNDSKYNLLNQQDFSGSYQLTTKSCLIMGKDNPPIHVSSRAKVDLTQTVEKKKIWTKIRFIDMTCETDSNPLKESLREMQLFHQINPVIVVRRDVNGKVKDIGNMPEIWQDWENWKEKRLSAIVADERKRQKLIKNYEAGLKSLEYNFDKNFQYRLLLPECYRFKDYPNPQDSSSTKTYSSRFIEKLDIDYCLEKQSFSDENNIVKLTSGARLFNEYAQEKQLIAFYEQYMPDFSCKDYRFAIKTEYRFKKKTSEIIDARLDLVEKLHSNFVYTIELELVHITEGKDVTDKQAVESDLAVPQKSNKPQRTWTTLLDDDDNVIIG